MSKATICPHCGYKIDNYTSTRDEKEKPEKGDITICISCGGWCKFEEDLSISKFDEEDQKNAEPLLIKNLTTISKKIKDANASNSN